MRKPSALEAGLDWQAANMAAGRAMSGAAAAKEENWQAGEDGLIHAVDAAMAVWEQRWPVEHGLALLPHEMDEHSRMRGRIDARMALLRFHDPSRHRVLLAASDASECELLELFEPLRCQRLAMSLAAGVTINLLGLWAELLGQTATERRANLAKFMLAMLSPSQCESLILHTCAGLDSACLLPAKELSPLAAAVNDQGRFAELLIELARTCAGSLLFTSAGTIRAVKEKPEAEFAADFPSEQTESQARIIQPNITPGTESCQDEDKAEHSDSDTYKQDSSGASHLELQRGAALAKALSYSEDYRVFWSGGDRILRPEKLVAPQRMETLWREFGKPPQPDNTARYAAKLRRYLLGLNLHSIEPEQEDGWPDPNALFRLITSPGFDRVFQRESESVHPRIAFSILLDCSGSMKGKPMHIAAHCTDGLIRVLERANLTVELLGFTTGSRGEGPALMRWQQAESPPQAGRLNETVHLLFKSEHEPWRRARHRLGALFEPSWLKENLDGEALAWAASRLLLRSEPRKILLVISDGAPLDRNTAQNHSDGYLEAHLHNVIANIAKTPIELAAIGLNYNIHRYYPNAVRLSRLDELGLVLFEWVERLIRKKAQAPGNRTLR
ncbi:MAG: hypothetical protein Q8L79_18865 [Methylobacter sp.]|uniref:cobaltochelatase CobT-related protein n=1 Tax=Methylobacter sp. TaxID=2051955 RepID=UPI0027308B22|nr:hypothetical protein [Methylobacter sp.]MDP1667171.1 hypothetical protein [Methylobacter sp.]